MIRFRLGTDEIQGAEGWYVDDVVIESEGDKIRNTASVSSDQSSQKTATVETPVTSSACQAPDGVTNVQTSKLDASTIRLEWNAVSNADQYEVWDALDDPYFTPVGKDCSAPAPYSCTVVTVTSYEDGSALGDVSQNHYYEILAANSCGSQRSVLSNRTGEFDFELVPGTP